MVIYLISNMINNKQYVGQTTRNLSDRWYNHTKYSGRGRSAISKAIHKYGKDNFKIEIIDTANSLEELNQKEQEWISKLNSLCPNGYNIAPGGKNKVIGAATRQKMSAAKKGRHHACTPEWKLHISESKTGVKFSPEHKQSLSKARKDKVRVRCINTGIVYDSYSEASRLLGLPVTTISRCARKIRTSAYGLYFEVVNE